MRKLSVKEKQQRGTLRADQAYKPARAEYEGYPDPPRKLTEAQTATYKQICNYLKNYGALMDADAILIAPLAVAISLQNEAADLLAEHGLIQVFKNGTRNVSPELSAFEKASALVAKLARELGVGVRSRDGLSVFLDVEEERPDPLADLMAQFE